MEKKNVEILSLQNENDQLESIITGYTQHDDAEFQVGQMLIDIKQLLRVQSETTHQLSQKMMCCQNTNTFSVLTGYSSRYN